MSLDPEQIDRRSLPHSSQQTLHRQGQSLVGVDTIVAFEDPVGIVAVREDAAEPDPTGAENAAQSHTNGIELRLIITAVAQVN